MPVVRECLLLPEWHTGLEYCSLPSLQAPGHTLAFLGLLGKARIWGNSSLNLRKHPYSLIGQSGRCPG